MVKSSWLWLTGGLLALLLGALWTLQGLNLLSGSSMSGVTMWAVIGPIVAIAGLTLLIVGLRKRGNTKSS
jgi:hypothetical protein